MIRKMYTLYLDYCKEQSIERVKEKMYYHIFTSKFNLHFNPPSKGTCQLCDSLEQTILHGSNVEVQNKAELEKELHLRKAKSARDSLKTDLFVSKQQCLRFYIRFGESISLSKIKLLRYIL